MSLRVLIVDGQMHAFRALLAEGLGDAYAVHQAATGADAICLAAEVFPQLAVIDREHAGDEWLRIMPGVEGRLARPAGGVACRA